MKTQLVSLFTFIFFCSFFVSSLSAQDNKVYTTPEKAPIYPGGKPAITKFLKDNIIYPETAKLDSTKGTVVVSFIIEKTGGISTIEVVEGLGKGCDEEATRVIRKMAKWYPGSNEGKAVRSFYKISVKFPQ